MLAVAALAVSRRAGGQTPTTDRIAAEADSVARTAGMPVDLRSAEVETGDLEIRAYVGVAAAPPYHLVRIVRSSGHITGALILWWPGTTLRNDVPDDPEQPIAQHDQETWVAAMRERVRGMGCGVVTAGGWVETCTFAQNPAIDWSGALAELESAHLTGLAALRASPGKGVASLYVEVRDGPRFDAYAYDAYGSPRRQGGDPDERAASHLVNMLLRLFPAGGASGAK